MTKLAFLPPALAAALALAAASSASAGSCPAGKAGIDVRPADSTPAKGVTDTVLNAVDLSKEPAAVNGRALRLRRLTIQPGGVVPWHSHGERPAIIYVVQGEVTEYASSCSAPIVHKAGESTPETHVTSHWWKNTGKGVAILLSADFFPQGADAHMM